MFIFQLKQFFFFILSTVNVNECPTDDRFKLLLLVMDFYANSFRLERLKCEFGLTLNKFEWNGLKDDAKQAIVVTATALCRA